MIATAEGLAVEFSPKNIGAMSVMGSSKPRKINSVKLLEAQEPFGSLWVLVSFYNQVRENHRQLKQQHLDNHIQADKEH